MISNTPNHTEYDTWAWLYNQTMGPEYCQNQLKPLEKILLPRLKQNAQILDLCCGTGQLVQILINQGYQITGIDNSTQMLNYARQNAPNGKFILADARQFELPPSFDAAFSTSAALNHIMTIPELQQVFQRVYLALKDNGWFLFDINHHQQMQRWWRGKIVEGEIENKYAWMLTPNYNPDERKGYFQVTMFQQKTKPSSTLLLRTMWRLFYPILNHRLLYKLRRKLLTEFQAKEKNWQRMSEKYPVRGHIPEEIKTALEQTGFTDIHILTLEGNPTIDDRHSAYFLCRKPVNI
ncbi:class I SAM-dependent methyltransferase [Nodularia chucula]|uniref:class I SAM-dependent methyltransferase n=1 Tax=Nodularia chucula TaxID=3093667 RepID=UPI0039C5ED11